MMALSLWDPYATLVAIEAKRWETRSWMTSYRGLIAIHATKKFDEDDKSICLCEPFRSALGDGGISTLDDMPRMAIIAVATLDRIEPTQQIRESLSPREVAFGDYSDKRFAWRFVNVWRLLEPIPCRGGRQLWRVSADVLTLVEEQLEGVAS